MSDSSCCRSSSHATMPIECTHVTDLSVAACVVHPLLRVAPPLEINDAFHLLAESMQPRTNWALNVDSTNVRGSDNGVFDIGL